METKKIVAITGATGAQGGGLARALLADSRGRYQVRAITRKPDSPAALELAKQGAEVVVADLDDTASLVKAFRGAEAAFCVTNFWEHFSAEKELAQAFSLATAARDTNLRHVIWSTLEDTRNLVPLTDDRMPTLQGRFKVPHFDAKGEANRFFDGLPVTLLNTSFYWDNLIYFGLGPKRQQDGSAAFVLPMSDKKLPGIAAADIGKCAAGIIARRDEFVGRTIGIAGEHLTGAEMAAQLTGVLGEPVAYSSVTPEMFRSFGFPGADDLGNMFQYKRDFETQFCAARDVAFTRSINSELQSFADFLKVNAAKIKVA